MFGLVGAKETVLQYFQNCPENSGRSSGAGSAGSDSKSEQDCFQTDHAPVMPPVRCMNYINLVA